MRIGIVGSGRMGLLHASLLQNRTGVQFIGFADLDLSRAESASKLVGGKAFGSVDALLNEGIDLVFVTVPNTKHAGVILESVKRGVRVFSEKPVVTSSQDAENILRELNSNSNRVYVGLNRRFAPVYAKAKELIANGFNVLSANFIMNDGDMAENSWVTNTKLTGGFLYDTTYHMFDMIRYLIGEVVEVSCHSQKCFYPLDNNFSMILRTENNQSIVLSTNGHASWAWPSERVQLWGDHATIVTEEFDSVTFNGSHESNYHSFNYRNMEKNFKLGYKQIHDDLFHSILNNQPPKVNFLDGYQSVLITEACYRSAANAGKPEKVQVLSKNL